jgi:hypothetical protein
MVGGPETTSRSTARLSPALVGLALGTLVGCGNDTAADGTGGTSNAGSAGSGTIAGAGGSGTGGGAGAGGMVVMDPPKEALVGMWQVFRVSTPGPCGAEPTGWQDQTAYFRLEATERGIETFRCSSATECVYAPWAYGDFYWANGEWTAGMQTFQEMPVCLIISDDQHLKMPEPGVLRRIWQRNEISGIQEDGTCGLRRIHPATCSDEYVQEATRIAGGGGGNGGSAGAAGAGANGGSVSGMGGAGGAANPPDWVVSCTRQCEAWSDHLCTDAVPLDQCAQSCANFATISPACGADFKAYWDCLVVASETCDKSVCDAESAAIDPVCTP